jgi:hypothetical protein
MSDYTSHSEYVPEERETPKFAPQVTRNNDTYTRSTVIDGVLSCEEVARVTTVNGQEVNDFPADDWRSTARDTIGNRQGRVGDATIVTINGIQASALDFQKAGYLVKDEGGEYRIPTEAAPVHPSVAEEAEYARHRAGLSRDENDAVNTALNGVSPDAADAVTQYGIAVALGRMSIGDVAKSFSTMTGLDPEASASRLTALHGVYQNQANTYLTAQQGLHPDELQDFYEFAKRSQNRDALSKAVNGQIYSKRLNGYEPLVKLYLATTVPQQHLLKAEGIETKTGTDGKGLVKVHGMWMSTACAALNGWV